MFAELLKLDLASLNANQIQRFWSHVDKTGDCWEWTGFRTKAGYGRLNLNGTVYGAHRISFLLVNGFMPMPYCLHSCDNPGCVNPSHLRQGDQLDNWRDMRERGRERSTPSPRLLTESDVVAIRASSGLSPADLAAKFKMSRSAIYHILKKRTWRHV